MTSKFDRTEMLTADTRIKEIVHRYHSGAINYPTAVHLMRVAGAFEAEINEALNG